MEGGRGSGTADRWSPLPPARPSSVGRVLAGLLPVVAVVPPAIAIQATDLPHRPTVLGILAAIVGGLLVAAVLQGGLARRTLLVVVGAIATATALGVATQAGKRMGAWTGAALLLVGWLSSSPGFRAGLARFVRALAVVLARIGFVPLAVLFVLVPWLVNAIARLDPLRTPTSPGSAWLRRRGHDPRASEPWATEPASARMGGWYRLRAVLVWPVLILAVLVAVRGPHLWPQRPRYRVVNGLDDDTLAEVKASEGATSPYQGATWYEEYVKDMAWIESPSVAWQPLQQRRIGDVHTRYVNVVDGVRTSWRAPACGCKRLKAWIYGGSTTFGLGQRDGHTIASELARVAWAHGVALDVDNRGVVGDVHWQEADRYAWDVATYGPPDLVIFYDGINDTTATQTLVNDRTGDRYAPVDFQNDDFWRRYLEVAKPTPSKAPPDSYVPKPPEVVIDSNEGFAELLMKRYQRSRKMSRAISKANGDVPTYYVWQPTRLARPQVKGEPQDTKDSEYGRERDAAIASAVPSDVLNLFKVFNPYRNPMFYDDQHHNEVGARIVASSLFDHLAPDLQRLLEGRRVSAG